MDSQRVGTRGIGVLDDGEIQFPTGLFGFGWCRSFHVISCDSMPNFRWLVSLDKPDILFLAVETYAMFPEYRVNMSEAEVEALDLLSVEEAAVLTLVSISGESGVLTTNLLAPLIVNPATRRGRQVILDDSGYQTKHAVRSGAREWLDASADTEIG